jgi:hypothetical protein
MFRRSPQGKRGILLRYLELDGADAARFIAGVGYGASFLMWMTQRLVPLNATESIPDFEAAMKHARLLDRIFLRRAIAKLKRTERGSGASTPPSAGV